MDEKIVDVIYTQYGPSGLLLLALIAAFWKIHSDLTKLRVEMALQLNRDLLSKRFTAYGDLWSRMQPTAIYTASGLGPSETIAFSNSLSDWYFSANGGLFLTRRAREFYFSLQDLLQSVGRLPGWRCDQRPDQPEKLDPEQWRISCKAVSEKLGALVNESDPKAGEAIYVSIQQVSSKLRTNLTHEIRSRLDVEWPVA